MSRTSQRILLILATLWLSGLSASAGQFKHVVYRPAGQRPYQVVAAQLTNSGNVDLVVADYLSSQIFVLLGNGDGTFQKPTKFSITAPIAVTIQFHFDLLLRWLTRVGW